MLFEKKFNKFSNVNIKFTFKTLKLFIMFHKWNNLFTTALKVIVQN